MKRYHSGEWPHKLSLLFWFISEQFSFIPSNVLRTFGSHVSHIWLNWLVCSYVSETERRNAFPYQAQRHILAGLASAVGGLTAPYEKASHVHERAVVNWLWAAGCHPFGPFSNTSEISQMLKDVALVWSSSSYLITCGYCYQALSALSLLRHVYQLNWCPLKIQLDIVKF